MIMSPWITPLVIDRPAIQSIRKLLERGVSLHIGYGLDEEHKPKKPIPETLEKLADEFPNFELRHFGNTHEKMLIKDSDYVVYTSFNWLSFRGDPNKKLRHELGIKVTDPTYVEREYSLMLDRFRRKSRRSSKSIEE
jgi:phosphatidylserine/phosphatidylglycerophosphate/cardiolipin synthase-like enzyme